MACDGGQPGQAVECADPPSPAVGHDRAGHRQADGPNGVVRIDDPERVEPVRGDREHPADAVGTARVRLVDGRLDLGLLQGHRRGRAGDAGADDEGGADVCHGYRSGVVGVVADGGAWNRAHSGPQPVSGWVMRSMNCSTNPASAASRASR